MINYFVTAEAGLQAAPPGADPDALRRTAATMRQLAQDLAGAIADSRSIAHDHRFWRGSAADAFRHLVGTAPKHLGQVDDRYRAYAAVLYVHAAEVETDRLLFVRQQQALRDADAAARATPDDGHDRVAAQRHRHVLEQLQNLNRCLDTAADHSRACARRLHHVDNADALHNPHGWHAVTDNAAVVVGQLATGVGMLAVVALIAFPPLGAVLVVVAVGLSAAKLGLDAGRRFGYGENVSWTDLGVDAVGVIPLGGIGGAGRAGVAAARTARAGGGLGRALGTGLRGFGTRAGADLGRVAAGATVGLRDIGRVGLSVHWPGLSIAVTETVRGWQAVGGAIDSWGFDSHGARGVVTGRWARNYFGWLARRIGTDRMVRTHSGLAPRRIVLTPRPARPVTA